MHRKSGVLEFPRMFCSITQSMNWSVINYVCDVSLSAVSLGKVNETYWYGKAEQTETQPRFPSEAIVKKIRAFQEALRHSRGKEDRRWFIAELCLQVERVTVGQLAYPAQVCFSEFSLNFLYYLAAKKNMYSS